MLQAHTASRREIRHLKRSSSLYKLDPFLDEFGLIRVSGKEKMEEISNEAKHPVVVPRKGHITKLIIRNAHEKMGHSGRGIT